MKRVVRALVSIIIAIGALMGASGAASANVSSADVRGALENLIANVCGSTRCQVDGTNNELFNIVTTDNRRQATGNTRMAVLASNGKSISNITGAGASCTNCTSIAANFIAVLLPANVSDVASVENRLFNAELDCNACTNVAYGHVVVVATNDSNPRLNRAAQQRLQWLRGRMDRLDRNMPLDALIRRLDALQAEFVDIVSKGTDHPVRWHRERTKTHGRDSEGHRNDSDRDSGRHDD
jgi:hypothetical protein